MLNIFLHHWLKDWFPLQHSCSVISCHRQTWGRAQKPACLCWRRTRLCSSTDSLSTKERLTRRQRRDAIWRMRVTTKTYSQELHTTKSKLVKCSRDMKVVLLHIYVLFLSADLIYMYVPNCFVAFFHILQLSIKISLTFSLIATNDHK